MIEDKILKLESPSYVHFTFYFVLLCDQVPVVQDISECSVHFLRLICVSAQNKNREYFSYIFLNRLFWMTWFLSCFVFYICLSPVIICVFH